MSTLLTSLRECWRQTAEEGALQNFLAATQGGRVRKVAERILHRVLLLATGSQNESFWQSYSLSLEILSMPHLTQKTVALKSFHPHEYPDSLCISLRSSSLPGGIPGSCFSLCGPLHSLPMTHKILTEPPLLLNSSPGAQSVPPPLYMSTISYWIPTPCLHFSRLPLACPVITDHFQPVSAIQWAGLSLLPWDLNQSLHLLFFVSLLVSVSLYTYVCVCVI